MLSSTGHEIFKSVKNTSTTTALRSMGSNIQHPERSLAQSVQTALSEPLGPYLQRRSSPTQRPDWTTHGLHGDQKVPMKKHPPSHIPKFVERTVTSSRILSESPLSQVDSSEECMARCRPSMPSHASSDSLFHSFRSSDQQPFKDLASDQNAAYTTKALPQTEKLLQSIELTPRKSQRPVDGWEDFMAYPPPPKEVPFLPGIPLYEDIPPPPAGFQKIEDTVLAFEDNEPVERATSPRSDSSDGPDDPAYLEELERKREACLEDWVVVREDVPADEKYTGPHGLQLRARTRKMRRELNRLGEGAIRELREVRQVPRRVRRFSDVGVELAVASDILRKRNTTGTFGFS